MQHDAEGELAACSVLKSDRLNHQEEQFLSNAAHSASFDRAPVLELTGLTRGQLSPTLTSLVKEGSVAMEHPSPRAKNQRYLL